jgi:hypothetical protein
MSEKYFSTVCEPNLTLPLVGVDADNANAAADRVFLHFTSRHKISRDITSSTQQQCALTSPMIDIA